MQTFAQKPEVTQSTRPGRTLLGPSPAVHPVLGLQQTIGNQAVQRLLIQREPAKDNKEARDFVEGVMWMMSESIREYQRDDLIHHKDRHTNTLAKDLMHGRAWFQQASARVTGDLGDDPDLQKKLKHIYRVYVYTAIDAFARKENRPVEALYGENEIWIEKPAAPLPTGKKWAALRWNEVIAVYRKLQDDVLKWTQKLDQFDQINGGRPKGWPDIDGLKSTRKKIESIDPIPAKVSALIDKIYAFLKAHPVLEKKDDGSYTRLDFATDPIGFLRYCESKFDDATGPLYRQWHEELSKDVQAVFDATDDMARAQAIADEVRVVIVNWHLMLENYRLRRQSNPQLPEHPTLP